MYNMAIDNSQFLLNKCISSNSKLKGI